MKSLAFKTAALFLILGVVTILLLTPVASTSAANRTDMQNANSSTTPQNTNSSARTAKKHKRVIKKRRIIKKHT